jgi:hypothetical protein
MPRRAHQRRDLKIAALIEAQNARCDWAKWV